MSRILDYNVINIFASNNKRTYIDINGAGAFEGILFNGNELTSEGTTLKNFVRTVLTKHQKHCKSVLLLLLSMHTRGS